MMLLTTMDGSRLAVEPEDICAIIEFKGRAAGADTNAPEIKPHCGIYIAAGVAAVRVALTFDAMLAAIQEYADEINEPEDDKLTATGTEPETKN